MPNRTPTERAELSRRPHASVRAAWPQPLRSPCADDEEPLTPEALELDEPAERGAYEEVLRRDP